MQICGTERSLLKRLGVIRVVFRPPVDPIPEDAGAAPAGGTANPNVASASAATNLNRAGIGIVMIFQRAATRLRCASEGYLR
jgi:hypothetical protein